VLQVHDRLNLRTPNRVISYDLSAVPFCTFDYRAFCMGLFDQTRARFLRASVTGCEDGAVTTTDGRFTAPVVVDCSGWRGALVHGGRGDRGGGELSFGLETYTTRSDRGLWLLLDRQLIRSGLGGIFPVGVGSLIGLGSYVGDSKLRPQLERLLRDEGVAPSHYHGTFFPNRLLRPTADRVFAVGDAAGQCLPLTAEGIRPALYFGGECGKIIQQVLDGALPLEAALERYRQVVERYRRPYRILQQVQWLAAHLPTRWFACLSALAARRPILPHWWPRYGWFGRFDQVPIASAS
jgi:flavin-dependent dehydrogenase